MENKIFFFDMDGTILGKDSQVLQGTKEAIKDARANGHKAAIATGRPYSEIITKVNKDDFDYLIANNGAYYYDVKNDVFKFSGTVSKEIALIFLDISIATDSMFAVHSNGQAYRGSFAKKDTAVEVDGKKEASISIEEMKEIINKYDIAQISLMNDIEIISKVVKDYENDLVGAEAHISNLVFLDIVPIGVSKLSAIKLILNQEGMDIKQSFGFGDSGNDYEMIKGCGTGVAMGNATQEIKDLANVVIGDNDSSAIADEIRKQTK